MGPVDVWLIPEADVDDRRHLPRMRALLDAEERDRAGRFLIGSDRRRYEIAHGMVRTILSEYAAVEPRAWRFVQSRYGRPELDRRAHDVGLRFNLSHTEGLVAIAVAEDREVGIDAETLRRPLPVMRLAGRFFAASEVDRLRERPAAERRRCFLELWTLKEAFAKARGLGLRLRFDQIAFDPSDPERILLRAPLAALGGDESWRFQLFSVGASHLVASCARGSPDDPATPRVRWIRPLRRDRPNLPPVSIMCHSGHARRDVSRDQNMERFSKE